MTNEQRVATEANQWDAVDLDGFFSNLTALRYHGTPNDSGLGHEELLQKLEAISKLHLQNKEDEQRFLTLLKDLMQRLEDSQLAILSRRMREIVGFKVATSSHKDLIQISNTVIDSIIGHVEREIARGVKPGRATILALVKVVKRSPQESARIRKVNNDVAEGINQPTLDKLQQFDRDYNSTYFPQPKSRPRPRPQPKSPLQKLAALFS